MKIKVRKEKLRAAIVKYVEKDKERFDRETERHKEKEAVARERYIARLTQYLADVKRGMEILQSYDLSNHLNRGCDWPKTVKVATDYGALLQRLDMAEDAVLVVDDHGEYMRFLAGECVCR